MRGCYGTAPGQRTGLCFSGTDRTKIIQVSEIPTTTLRRTLGSYSPTLGFFPLRALRLALVAESGPVPVPLLLLLLLFLLPLDPFLRFLGLLPFPLILGLLPLPLIFGLLLFPCLCFPGPLLLRLPPLRAYINAKMLVSY
jgi:hypothetical protein